MKKRTTKLSLNRDTVHQLDCFEPVVAGAYTARCTFSGYRTCLTCEMTCTTNFC